MNPRSASSMLSCFPRRVKMLLVAVTAGCAVYAAQGATSHRAVRRPVARHVDARIEAIRFWSFGDVTRVAIQTGGPYKLRSDQIERPSRLYYDFSGLLPPVSKHRGPQIISVNDRFVRQIRVAEVSPGVTRIVFDLSGPATATASELVNPNRLMLEIRPKNAPAPNVMVAQSVAGSKTLGAPEPPLIVAGASTSSAPVSPALPPKVAPATIVDTPPTAAQTTAAVNATVRENRTTGPMVRAGREKEEAAASITESSRAISRSNRKSASRQADDVIVAEADSTGDRSLVRVFGLKLAKVVIDPGHGGHDTGTIGPHGLMEKDLALDVALRLGQLISQRMGAEVVYTRSDDTFIPLEQRTKIANNEKADLFISIHANSSPEPSATGVETYYFNFTGDRNSLDLATRENATAGSSISDLSDLLHKAVLTAKMDESREFAQKVQASLWSVSTKMNSRSRDRGVRTAPFVVLIGATMPSILAEIGFVSNSHDENLLKKGDEREKIAEGLYKGIAQYASTLSHMQMAQVTAGE